jgi:AcrR family transcriptional regulator
MLSTAERIDPRVKRTRQLLLDAFQSLLREKSFEDITVQDIAARATVNRATFYAHFIDKYALVDELIRENFAQLLQRHQAPHAGSTAEHLRRLILAVCDYWAMLQQECRHSYRVFDTLVEAQIKAQLREQVLAGLQARGVAQAHDSRQLELLATIVSWGIYGAALQWSRSPQGQSAEAFADAALPLIVAGIGVLDAYAR